ncbi:uncharacterized protein [Anas platyrhynchos]|uniref:uncharacterized protein isoform X1 n=1 Tax=Anas platyrhynchos TaxID=8839 RepID=UPI003AF22191
MGICSHVNLSGWEMTMRMKAGPGLGNAQDGQEAVWKRRGHGKYCVGGKACWGWPSLALGSLLGSKACSPPQDVGEGLVSRWDGTPVARVPQATAPLSSHHGRSSSRLPLLPGLRPCWRAQRPRAQPSALFPTEGFPRWLPRLPQTQNSPFVVPAVPPTVAAWLLPSLPGATALPLQPLQVPTLPSALPQATVWHVVPGVQGQVLQLPARVQLPPGGHLPAQGHHLQLGQLLAAAMGQLLAGGQLPAVGHNLQLVQLPAVGQNLPLVQLPTMGHQLQLVQLPAVGQLPHTAPPCAPVHQWGQPMVTGTLVPHHALGLGPGPRAVLHGELLHPAGTCLLQAPAQRNPPPPLVPGPPLREQALPAPRTLSSSRGQLPEPCLHAVGLSEDQGPPLPGPTPPEPAQAPATASTQTATPDAATLAEVPEEPLELLELGPDAFAEAFPQLAGDSQQLQHLQDQLPADLDSSGLEELLSCLDAVEPQDAFAAVPSSPVLKRFLSQLPDLCEDIEEPSTQGLAATRALGEVPSSPGLHPDKVQAGRALQPPAAAVPPLSSPLKPAARPQLRRALPKRPPLQEFIPARRRTLPQPPLAPLKRRPNPDCLPARKRPLPQPPQAPVQSPPDPDFLTALRRALPKPRLSPLQSPPDPARRRPMPKPLPKRPPQQEFIPARKRTLPQPPLAPLKRPQLLPALRRALPSPPRSPLQSPPPAPAPTGTKWGAKRPAPTSTPSTAQSSQHRQLRLPGSSAVPAAPRLLASRKAQALPAPPGSTAAARKAPLKQAPRALGLPAAGGQAQRLALPTQPRTLQRPAQPRGDYVPCVGPWAGGDAAPTPLEEQESSVPITPQQRPERERLKKLAQEERQRAAHHMRIGPGQFFEQRQKDHARAYSYGYP